MAKITVEIELPGIAQEDIIQDEWLEGEDIIVDENWLTRYEEDDSFFRFKFVKAED